MLVKWNTLLLEPKIMLDEALTADIVSALPKRCAKAECTRTNLCEATNCLLADGGIVLKREAMGLELVCKVLYPYTCLHFHLRIQPMPSQQDSKQRPQRRRGWSKQQRRQMAG